MRTVKASLKVNKNGRLYCTVHKTYKVSVPPKNHCKICWELYESREKQKDLDQTVSFLHNIFQGGIGPNESN